MLISAKTIYVTCAHTQTNTQIIPFSRPLSFLNDKRVVISLHKCDGGSGNTASTATASGRHTENATTNDDKLINHKTDINYDGGFARLVPSEHNTPRERRIVSHPNDLPAFNGMTGLRGYASVVCALPSPIPVDLAVMRIGYGLFAVSPDPGNTSC